MSQVHHRGEQGHAKQLARIQTGALPESLSLVSSFSRWCTIYIPFYRISPQTYQLSWRLSICGASAYTCHRLLRCPVDCLQMYRINNSSNDSENCSSYEIRSIDPSLKYSKRKKQSDIELGGHARISTPSHFVKSLVCLLLQISNCMDLRVKRL